PMRCTLIRCTPVRCTLVRRAPHRRAPHRPLLLPAPKFLTPKLLRAEIASRNCVPEAFPVRSATTLSDTPPFRTPRTNGHHTFYHYTIQRMIISSFQKCIY